MSVLWHTVLVKRVLLTVVSGCWLTSYWSRNDTFVWQCPTVPAFLDFCFTTLSITIHWGQWKCLDEISLGSYELSADACSILGITLQWTRFLVANICTKTPLACLFWFCLMSFVKWMMQYVVDMYTHMQCCAVKGQVRTLDNPVRTSIHVGKCNFKIYKCPSWNYPHLSSLVHVFSLVNDQMWLLQPTLYSRLIIVIHDMRGRPHILVKIV